MILMPLRDDWPSAAWLARKLDEAIPRDAYSLRILMVDDGSVESCRPEQFQGPFSTLQAIEVLRLRRNLGHQRAIAVGLAYLHANAIADAVLVMDADGEDTAAGVLQLLEAFAESGRDDVVFAKRARRSESLLFRCSYHAYRYLHRILTGINVRVGNFSIVPWKRLGTVVAMSELWNHYAASIFRSRIPFRMIPIARGRRTFGSSKMNFTALISHGLSAVSVFSDIVGVRLLVLSLLTSCLCALGIIGVFVIRFFSNLAIPGWATYATGTLAIIMIQLVTIASSFTFFMLSSRSNLGFIPFRDYSLFVEEMVVIFS